jgi:hypothetical protein
MADDKLIDADRPLILFPVRLETRFFGAELWVRVYPDKLHIDTHEPELTADELQWGKHFHESRWRAADDAARRQGAWSQLAERFGAERATWIARQLIPLNEGNRPQTPLPETVPLPAVPQFPNAPARPAALANETWTRAPWTRVLPDRWIATVFINGRAAASATGLPIPDPLPVGPDPKLTITEDPDGPPVDDGIKWMIDFRAAERIGMALRITLPPLSTGTQIRIDRLIVAGVKSSLDAATGAARITELMRAHQYTDGLSLLAQGTPSNNTEDSPSAFSSDDPGHEKSARRYFAGARFQTADGSDGDELCKALGVAADVFAFADGSEAREQMESRSMQRALWPATWGYYLEHMLYGVFPDADVDANLRWGREHFVEHVRAGGPLPTLRIGKQPYGLLPVTSLAQWAPAPGEQSDPAKDAGLVTFLRRQQPIWLRSSSAAPRMGRNNDPDTDFLEIFSMDAVSAHYAARNVMGEKYVWHLLGFFNLFPIDATTHSNVIFQRWQDQHVSMARASLDLAGLRPEAMASRLALALHFQESEELNTLRRIQDADADTLVFNYVDALAKAPSLDAVVRHDSIPGLYSMLYLLLRHALLQEYAAAAARILHLAPAQRIEEDQIGFTQLGAVETSLARISRAGLRTGAAFTNPADAQVKEFREALLRLKDLPVERLDLLMRGALDLSSHRLDAWITSFASKRLKHMRSAAASGIYIGAYGWVENFQPAISNQPIPPPSENGPVVNLANNPGFVHTPSLDHAATVAVLRSGHLSHAATGKQDLLAVDLSSERARLVQWLLDGVKAGQPLGALLGYRFERGLHENHPGFFLDRFIAPLRDLMPLTAIRVDQSGQPEESVAAKHVVDGLKLFRRWKAEPGFIRNTLRVTPPAQAAEFAAVEAELGALADAVDAVSDALLAESVHQVVRGNPVRAAATLDAVERGEAPPPELEVLRTPRSGTALTHRVLVMCPTEPAAPQWPGAVGSPRGAAEPALNAWAALFLGNPRKVRLRVDRLDPTTGAVLESRELLLGDMKLGPLDVLFTSESTDELRQSELEQQILYHSRRQMRDLPANAILKINPERLPAWPMTDLSWSEFMELASAARRLIAGARPLRAADLTIDDLDDFEATDIAELQRRADDAAAQLRLATEALRTAIAAASAASIDNLRDAMLAMTYFGIPGAIPLSATGDSEGDLSTLMFQARSLEKEATNRLGNVDAADRSLASGDSIDSLRLQLHQQRLREVFGAGFMVLPRLSAPNAADIEKALSASTKVQGGDPFAVITFHQRMARVRDGIARLDDLLRYAEALATEDRLTLQVAQLPHQEDDLWIGLPITPDRPLGAGRLSVIMHIGGVVDFTKPLAGLMIDEWVEVVPNTSETTGVVFQSNQPDAAPPQAILVAVPPNAAAQNFWTEPALTQVLLETMDLVRVRAVTPDLLEELGQYLPALYFSLNAAGDTISTGFIVPG